MAFSSRVLDSRASKCYALLKVNKINLYGTIASQNKDIWNIVLAINSPQHLTHKPEDHWEWTNAKRRALNITTQQKLHQFEACLSQLCLTSWDNIWGTSVDITWVFNVGSFCVKSTKFQEVDWLKTVDFVIYLFSGEIQTISSGESQYIKAGYNSILFSFFEVS